MAVLDEFRYHVPCLISGTDLRRECIACSIECGVHAYGGQYHLGNGICYTSDASRLPQEIAPTDDPRPNSGVFRRNDILRDKVHPTSSGIGGNEFSH